MSPGARNCRLTYPEQPFRRVRQVEIRPPQGQVRPDTVAKTAAVVVHLQQHGATFKVQEATSSLARS